MTGQEFTVEPRRNIQYGAHDGTALVGDLYLPEGTGSDAMGAQPRRG